MCIRDRSGTITSNGINSNGAVLPVTSNGAALGSTSKQWSDLFLASGGVINFNNGDITLTHSAGSQHLKLAGGNLNVAGHITASGNISASGDIFAQDLTLRDDGTGDDHPILHLRNDTRSTAAASAIRFSSGSYDSNPATTPGSATIIHNPTTAAFTIENNNGLGNIQLSTSGSSRVTVAGNGDVQFTGNITASGNISGSATSTGSFAQVIASNRLIVNDDNNSGPTWPEIYVEGEILATGQITSDNGLRVRNSGTDKINLDNSGHITASGDISSSGNVYAQGGSSNGFLLENTTALSTQGGILFVGNSNLSLIHI